MAQSVGLWGWSREDDREGHREYKARFLVMAGSTDEGPATVMAASGLPLTGSYWDWFSDSDQWAFCTPEGSARPYYEGEKGYYWWVDKVFSTRPLFRCQDNQISNPMFEPPRIGGSFKTYSEERFFDRKGNAIISSSFEPYEGTEVEFDAGRPDITIGLNFPFMPMPVFCPFMHVLNDFPIWGFNTACVKLSGATWRKVLYGTCSHFYTVDYEFDVNFNTFDRYLPDRGHRVVKAGGNFRNPKDFIPYKDKNQENALAFLNGRGEAIDTLQELWVWRLEGYQRGNLLSLGVPSILE